MNYQEMDNRAKNEKYCLGCKQFLPANEEYFYIRKKILKTGEIVRKPEGRCRECSRAMARDIQRLKRDPNSGCSRYNANKKTISHTGYKKGTVDHIFYCMLKPTPLSEEIRKSGLKNGFR